MKALTFERLKKALEANNNGVFKKADEGRGMAFVPFRGDCIVMGKHNAFPKTAWLAAADGVNLESDYPMWKIEESLQSVQTGSYFGSPVWGPTGSYTVC
jgi:hypothetical protein